MTAITLDHALSRSSAKFVLASVLSVLACISVAQGVINAASFSQDFQWSPTVLLIRHGVDPYEEFLLDPSTERILLTQIPLYSHFLYLLLSPLAFIPFETAKLVWAGLNLTFCVSVFFLLRRQISRDGLVALFLVFMCSTATRNAIGNGQQSLLSLVLYAAAIRLSATGFGLLGPLVGGVAAFKYSFGVPMFFAFDRWRFVNAITYVIPSLVGVFFWSLYFGKPIIEAGALPLRLSSNVAMGQGDLLSILRAFECSRMWCYGAPLVIVAVIIAFQRLMLPIKDALELCAFYSVVSLLLIVHLGYDYVFLVFPALVFARATPIIRMIGAAAIGYFWFGLKMLSFFGQLDGLLIFNHGVMWMLLSALVFQLGRDLRHRGVIDPVPSIKCSGRF